MAISFETYEEAAEATDPATHMVCGVRVSESEDRYFTVPRETPDQVVHDISFEIKYGRPLTSYDRWIAEMAARETTAA